jgi:hypothetical protein
VTLVTETLSVAVPLTAMGEVVLLVVGGIGLVIVAVGIVVSGATSGSGMGFNDIINSSNHIVAPLGSVLPTPV